MGSLREVLFDVHFRALKIDLFGQFYSVSLKFEFARKVERITTYIL